MTDEPQPQVMELTWGEGLLNFTLGGLGSWESDRDAPVAAWLSLYQFGREWRSSHIMSGAVWTGATAQEALNGLREEMVVRRRHIGAALEVGQPPGPEVMLTACRNGDQYVAHEGAEIKEGHPYGIGTSEWEALDHLRVAVDEGQCDTSERAKIARHL